MELCDGSYTYGWQQSRIFHNGRKPDGATPRAGRRSSDCKLLLIGRKVVRNQVSGYNNHLITTNENN